MRNVMQLAIAATITSLFAVMFWGQIGALATAAARGKAETYATTANPYLPIHNLEPVY
jgi:hypothetical protein